MKGFSEVMVLGKETDSKKFNSYVTAFNHDTRFLNGELVDSLISSIKQLPREQKELLKNKLMEMDAENNVDQTIKISKEETLNGSNNG